MILSWVLKYLGRKQHNSPNGRGTRQGTQRLLWKTRNSLEPVLRSPRVGERRIRKTGRSANGEPICKDERSSIDRDGLGHIRMFVFRITSIRLLYILRWNIYSLLISLGEYYYSLWKGFKKKYIKKWTGGSLYKTPPLFEKWTACNLFSWKQIS